MHFECIHYYVMHSTLKNVVLRILVYVFRFSGYSHLCRFSVQQHLCFDLDKEGKRNFVSLWKLLVNSSVEDLWDTHKKHNSLAFRMRFQMKVNKHIVYFLFILLFYSSQLNNQAKKIQDMSSCFKLLLYILCTMQGLCVCGDSGYVL